MEDSGGVLAVGTDCRSWRKCSWAWRVVRIWAVVEGVVGWGRAERRRRWVSWWGVTCSWWWRVGEGGFVACSGGGDGVVVVVVEGGDGGRRVRIDQVGLERSV
jgi:hypothetical protein